MARRVRRSRSLVPLLAVTLSGCWGSTYDERLEGTAQWYGHLERLDRVLATPAWADGCVTYFRPPREFTLQFAPGPSPEPVPLVPEFVRGSLEGLRAVWRADLAITDPTDPSATAPAYLFVVDNHSLWTSTSVTKRRSASTFKNRIGQAVAREFSIQRGNVESWEELRPAGYGTLRSFRKLEGDELAERIDGRRYELWAYAFVTGDVHGAVFYVVPVEARDKAALEEAIKLSIGTLEPMRSAPQPVPEKPARPANGGGGVVPGADF